MRALCVSLCVLATATCADAQTPALSISLFESNIAEVSWPTNFSTWQLATTTNLASSGSWQPVTSTPLPLGDRLLVFVLITNNSSFFRLQPNSGGGGLRVSCDAVHDCSRRQQHAELVSRCRYYLDRKS